MDKLFAKRMDELVPSGIRKVNEKAQERRSFTLS